MLCSAQHITEKHVNSECMKSVQKCCHAVLNAEVTLECGSKLSVIADACQSYKEIMPVGIGMIGDRNVLVLRDTGCSTVVIKHDLVKE